MRIIPYEEKYRDDMIFMVLEAKNALGRVPKLNDDLLNIRESYFDKGDMFWIALNDDSRVVGCVGYSSIHDSSEVFLHRLFIKYNLKHQGIGTALLCVAEKHIKSKGKTAIRVHLGAPREQWYESYNFYPKNGYVEYEPRYMKKELCVCVT